MKKANEFDGALPKRLQGLIQRSERDGAAINLLADEMARDIVRDARKAKVA